MAKSGEVFYGQLVYRSEGGWTAEGGVGRRKADGRKFLLLFRTAQLASLLQLKIEINKIASLPDFWPRPFRCFK